MQRIRTVFALCAALTAVAALAFLNNLAAIVRWWRAFLAAGGDSAGVDAHAPGFIPWLDWTAVDYSAVTTLIPLVGLAFLTRAAWGLWRGRRRRTEDYPFFRGSDQLFVALGLFGTLWGIIVIGYFKLETVSMADLMQCLHTALFSTLMAVVWVFLIDRPLLRPWFLKLLTEAKLADFDESDLAAGVERLVASLGEASAAFDRRSQAYEAAFAARQQALADEFTRRLDELDRALERRHAAEDEALAAHLKRLADEASARSRAEAEVSAQRIAAFDESLAGALARFEAAAARRAETFEAEFERRRQEYAQFFERRIAELSAEGQAAREQAARAERRLAGVAAALAAADAKEA